MAIEDSCCGVGGQQKRRAQIEEVRRSMRDYMIWAYLCEEKMCTCSMCDGEVDGDVGVVFVLVQASVEGMCVMVMLAAGVMPAFRPAVPSTYPCHLTARRGF